MRGSLEKSVLEPEGVRSVRLRSGRPRVMETEGYKRKRPLWGRLETSDLWEVKIPGQFHREIDVVGLGQGVYEDTLDETMVMEVINLGRY